VVHSDDFTFEGEDRDLDWIEKKMAGWFDVKVRGRLGPEPEDQKEITILGRVVSWEEWGISYRADPVFRLGCELPHAHNQWRQGRGKLPGRGARE
jgi:hypothetical protein